MIQKVHIFITGDVVGVGFRSWVLRLAKKMKLKGWVKNTENREVEVVAEGERMLLLDFIQACNEGPEISWVEKVNVDWQEAKDEFTEFSIR
jgi:acylphosphatase